MQRTQFIYIWKLLYMFRVVHPPIIRRAHNCIYSIWYLSHRYCYLPLSWKSCNRFECAVGGVRHVPRDMVCLRNVSVNTLHKGETEDNNNNNNNNNNNRLGPSGVRIPAGGKLSFLQEIHTGSQTHPAYCSMTVDRFFSQG
jgi:hypothetical protein